MTENLKNKDEVVAKLTEYYERHGLCDQETARIFARAAWGILLRAGLVEEPREPGWYWCKPFDYAASEWMAVKFVGGEWYGAGLLFRVGTHPHIIGPRIHPPAD